MGHATFGDDRFRKLAHLSGIATKHCDVKAALVIVAMMAMMLVVRVRQPLGQLPAMVVEDIGEAPHIFMPPIPLMPPVPAAPIPITLNSTSIGPACSKLSIALTRSPLVSGWVRCVNIKW
jgi:hypothetical protein